MSNQQLNQQQLWGLALGACLAEINNERHDTLYGCEKTSGRAKAWKQGLSSDWDIDSAEDFANTLEDLPDDGHNAEFANIRALMSLLTEEEAENAIRQMPVELQSKYRVVKYYDHVLPEAGIAAWDIGRYVFLCRKGALIGYITDEDAWEMILEIAKTVQKLYSGWEQYYTAYMIGRQFWAEDLTKDYAVENVATIHQILMDPELACSKLPWELEL